MVYSVRSIAPASKARCMPMFACESSGCVLGVVLFAASGHEPSMQHKPHQPHGWHIPQAIIFTAIPHRPFEHVLVFVLAGSVVFAHPRISEVQKLHRAQHVQHSKQQPHGCILRRSHMLSFGDCPLNVSCCDFLPAGVLPVAADTPAGPVDTTAELPGCTIIVVVFASGFAGWFASVFAIILYRDVVKCKKYRT